VFCTNGGNGRFPATELNRIDIDEVTTLLLGNNGMMISEGMPGSDMFATSPIRDSYFAFGNTDLCGSRGLGQVEGFVSKNAYPSSKNESKYSEWGSVGNARFLVSSVGAKEINGAGVGVDMYTIPFVAQEAYASVKLAGYASQFVYRPAHLNGALALFSTLGFKMRHASAILNDQWVALLKCTLA
jgi:N4-gp56 family major capsid protein